MLEGATPDFVPPTRALLRCVEEAGKQLAVGLGADQKQPQRPAGGVQAGSGPVVALHGDPAPVDPGRRLLGEAPGAPVVVEGLGDGLGLRPQAGVEGVAEEIAEGAPLVLDEGEGQAGLAAGDLAA